MAMTLLFLLISTLVVIVHPHPTYPGSCSSPNALVGPGTGHVIDSVRKTLAQGNVQMLVNGAPMTPGGTTVVTAGTPYTLQLKGITTTNNFRGFLKKLYRTGVNTLGMLTTSDAAASTAALCTSLNIAGIGHISKTPKNAVTSTFQSSTTGLLTLEVTVVVTEALSYFGSFTLNVTSAGPVPTTKPTRKPTRKPTTRKPTTRKPTGMPTIEPTVEPTTGTPTRKPTRKPTTRKPTRAPTGALTTFPNFSPDTPFPSSAS